MRRRFFRAARADNQTEEGKGRYYGRAREKPVAKFAGETGTTPAAADGELLNAKIGKPNEKLSPSYSIQLACRFTAKQVAIAAPSP
jgi:hypothetical protein